MCQRAAFAGVWVLIVGAKAVGVFIVGFLSNDIRVLGILLFRERWKALQVTDDRNGSLLLAIVDLLGGKLIGGIVRRVCRRLHMVSCRCSFFVVTI